MIIGVSTTLIDELQPMFCFLEFTTYILGYNIFQIYSYFIKT
jgi:hypothetical protein